MLIVFTLSSFLKIVDILFKLRPLISAQSTQLVKLS